MEPNIPVGSTAGVRGRHGARAGRRASASSEAGRQRQVGGALEDGAHRAAGVGAGRRRQPARPQRSRRSPTTTPDADALLAARRRRRAPCAAPAICISVALQYGNAFGQGLQAAALKPADFFGDDDVLYLMEDMATGEIRLSILWEWLHKQAHVHRRRRPPPASRAGDTLTPALFARLLDEEYAKLLRRQQSRRARRLEDDDPADRPRHRRHATSTSRGQGAVVHRPAEPRPSTTTTAPKPPAGVAAYMKAFAEDGTRITRNVDFDRPV